MIFPCLIMPLRRVGESTASLWLCTFLLGLALLCLPLHVQAGKDDLPKPAWSWSCATPFTVCSTVEVYQYWPEKKNRLTMAVDALMNDPNAKGVLTVWMVMDQPDINLAKDLFRDGFNVVLVYPRGSRETTSYLACAQTPQPHNHNCWITPACASEIAAESTKKESPFNATHYAADQTVEDLDWVLRTLGADRPNVLLGEGLSSMLVLRLLKSHPGTKAAVMLMDFVNPLVFDVYNYFGGGGMDAALQHLLDMCDDQVACVGRLGAAEGSWNRLQTILMMARTNTLACASRLDWLRNNPHTEFADQLRALLALMMRFPAYPFTRMNADVMNLIPSLLYRLQRCNDGDVVALNKLFAYLTASSGKADTCPASLAVQMHWLVNDFVQHPAPSDIVTFRTKAASKYLLLPSRDDLTTFHGAAAAFPRTNRSASSQTLPVDATQHILLLTADLDAVLPLGAASQVAMSFHRLGDTVQLRQIRGISNQPSSVLTSCIKANLKMMRDRSSWADEDQCKLDAAHKIDFINGATDLYYGTSDAWDFDKSNSDDTGRKGEDDPNGSHNTPWWRKLFRVVLVLLLLAAIASCGYYAFQYLKQRGTFRFDRVSDNFYENLHQ